jgi:regulatory protein
MEKAVQYLAVRSHTRWELGRKLRACGVGEERIEETLDSCCARRYLDDRATAGQLAEEMIRKGYGPLKIRAHLRGKGVDGEVIDETLEALEASDGFWEAGRKSMQKKMPSLQRDANPARRREKMFRFLVQRGFPKAMVMALVHEMT